VKFFGTALDPTLWSIRILATIKIILRAVELPAFEIPEK
jgi:hypothetical protein